MKFDVIVGNPPYNPPKNFVKGPNQSIWPNFVHKSFELLAPKGFLCLVHPSAWRKPEHELWPVMTEKQIHHLRMISKKDGTAAFGAGIRVDWYVIQNTSYQHATEIVDQDNVRTMLDIRNVKFIPSGMLDDVSTILGDDGECFDVVLSYSSYDPRKEWMSKEQTEENIHPCIHSITSEGLRVVYSKVNDRGHFGVTKVIINCGEILYPYNDFRGEYGMTQNSFGLVIHSEQEGNLIVAAMNTAKFKKIVAATKWGTNAMVEWRMFKYIRRDFWRHFVDNEGNPL